jgi:choline dehydrogenase-like flavoprotein
MPVHAAAASFTSPGEARAAIAALPLAPLVATVVSAHVMGGCAFGPDPARAVVDPTGRHHHVENLYVLDGSVFPTSIGANPQISIYAVTAKLATGLAQALGRRLV